MLSLLTMNPLIVAIVRSETIKKISTFFLTVHIARNSIIASTISCDAVVKGLVEVLPQNKSLTKPVQVASQKPMKKRRCIKNRFSNFMTVAIAGGCYCLVCYYFSLP